MTQRELTLLVRATRVLVKGEVGEVRLWWRREHPVVTHEQRDLIPDIVVVREQLSDMLVTLRAFETRLRAASEPLPDEEGNDG